MMRRCRCALALGCLLALGARGAVAQTKYLAVSEVNGTSGRGQVAIYQLNAAGTAVASTTPYSTITGLSVPSGPQVANPFGLAVSGNDLFIASLGTNQILDYNLTTSTLSLFQDVGALGHRNINGLAVSGGNLYASTYDGGTTSSPGAVIEFATATAGASPVQVYSGGGLVGPTGLTVTSGGTVFINSSETNDIYALTGSSRPGLFYYGDGYINSPAGLTFGTLPGTTATYLYDTSFAAAPSTGSTGIATYTLSGGITGFLAIAGGPAGLLQLTGTNTMLVSNYTTGNITACSMGGYGSLTVGSTFLTLGAGTSPTYMTEFSYSGTFRSVPEPSSLALLGLGLASGFVALRRRARITRAG